MHQILLGIFIWQMILVQRGYVDKRVGDFSDQANAIIIWNGVGNNLVVDLKGGWVIVYSKNRIQLFYCILYYN